MDIQEMLEKTILHRRHHWLWQPHKDDAQAFRLMVDCEIDVVFHRFYVDALMSGDPSMVYREHHVDHNGDKLAATRMAILRAAAGC